jgi:hypothetical protein
VWVEVLPDEPYVSGEVSGPWPPPVVLVLPFVVFVGGELEPVPVLELDGELPEGCEPLVGVVPVLLGVPVALGSVGVAVPVDVSAVVGSVPALTVVPSVVAEPLVELVLSVEVVGAGATVEAGVDDDVGGVRAALCLILACVVCDAAAAFD